MVACKGTTLYEDKKVLLLRVLEDGRGHIPKGHGHNQSVVHTADKGCKDDTADTTSVLRYGEERVAVVPKVKSCKNLDVVWKLITNTKYNVFVI